jgi:23S rRNA (cytidine1920-2'-O)/16S rRNA (cytidine1409-2'-O)-methyltransferase
VARQARLDAELVRRGLARSRAEAGELIDSGRVTVAGWPAAKASTAVAPDAPIVVADGGRRWVSRGAVKLTGALDALPALRVEGRRCLDAGASTGGFTEVLLDRGAAGVVAVDVGYGQLAWSLRSDKRVSVLERTNVRHLQPGQIDGAVDLTVADLSFISLRLVLPALRACTISSGDLLVMCKPQFEVGRSEVGAGGVVRESEQRTAAVAGVAEAAALLGLGTVDIVPSPLPGPRGNVEYFLWLRDAVAGWRRRPWPAVRSDKPRSDKPRRGAPFSASGGPYRTRPGAGGRPRPGEGTGRPRHRLPVPADGGGRA